MIRFALIPLAWLTLAFVLAAATEGVIASEPGDTDTGFSGTTSLVRTLLKDRDPETFARKIAPSVEDWQSVSDSPDRVEGERSSEEAYEERSESMRERIEVSARHLLETAVEAGFDPANLAFSHMVEPGSFGYTDYGAYLHQLRFVFLGEGPNGETSDEFEIALYELSEFPAGWRCYGGIQWTRLPERLMTDELRREFRLVEAGYSFRGTVDASVDPLLEEVAGDVLDYLQTRSAESRNRLFWSREEITEALQQAGVEPSAVNESLEYFETVIAMFVESLDATADRLEGIGVDFNRFEPRIENVVAEISRSRSQGIERLLDDVFARSISITFTLPPGSESAGRPIDGRYVFAIGSADQSNGRWVITDEVRWEQLPEHLVTVEDVEDIEAGNYIAEHGALPPGTPAPDIELVPIDAADRRILLSDFRGQVVILEFWASWCGPCQEPMARLQELVGNHPEWEGRVAVIALSIDGDIEEAREHLERRGWDRTLNLWAGSGGFLSESARAFHVNGIPRFVILDADGVVRHSGTPVRARFSEMVTDLLED